MNKTINSAGSYRDRTLEIKEVCDGTNLVIHSGAIKGDLGITVNRADLLTALDATANTDVKIRVDVYAKLTEAEDELRTLRATAKHTTELTERAEAMAANWERLANTHLEQKHAMEDKLEAAEAKLARVREIIVTQIDPHHQGVVVAARVAESIRAALADPEPFVLPTEAGARFIARHGNGAESEFITYSSGDDAIYSGVGTMWTAKAVMDKFTGHRLIEDGAA
jgi:hypothetical protein